MPRASPFGKCGIAMEQALPPPGTEVLFTADKNGVATPIPTHFFKVVLARVNGKRVAIGFLIPHRADPGMKDLRRFVVPVRVIEGVTGIDFIPELKAIEELETKSEARWFSANPANTSL